MPKKGGGGREYYQSNMDKTRRESQQTNVLVAHAPENWQPFFILAAKTSLLKFKEPHWKKG